MSVVTDTANDIPNESANDNAEGSTNALLPIAIVGMACRFPGGDNLDSFYKLCAQGRSGWCETPSNRFSNDGFYDPSHEKPGTINYRGGHYIKHDLALFDAPFFNIPAKQAETMDPKYRMMLECVYEALENGGIPLGSVPNEEVGVYMSGAGLDYTLNLFRDMETIPTSTGPSIMIDTACSSSITALHLACQSIKSGEITMAIVGGCHLNILPDVAIGILFSPDGKSYSFDERATSGFGRGEGIACIVIKAVKEAKDADDPIRAVIRNTGVNQDGKTYGITTPSRDSQEALIRSTYGQVGIDPKGTHYIEAHGTGTATGDPIEADALGAVFGQSADQRDSIYIGSVKSNIGHLEEASGLASIIKTVLMMERCIILPNHDFQKIRASIPFSKWGFEIPRSMKYWPQNGIRRASVSNYGFGGSNGHVILEEAPPNLPIQANTGGPEKGAYPQNGILAQSRRCLFVLTGYDDLAVTHGMDKLAMYLQKRRESIFPNLLADLAHTLNYRRTMFSWRVAMHAQSIDELVSKCKNPKHNPVAATGKPRLGFVFTGQGAQWYGMGRELFNSYQVFEASIAASDEILSSFGAQWSLREELMRDEKSSKINEPYVSQPACTALQIALVELLKSWGVVPTAVIGHSGGETAAAYAAGALSIRDTLTVAYFRGQSVEQLRAANTGPKGSMTAVGLGKAALDTFIEKLQPGKLVVACINSPESCTVSGEISALSELESQLDEKLIFYRRLPLDIAYHSSHVAPVADYYRRCMDKIEILEASVVQLYSALTGKLEPLSSLGAFYWVLNLLCPVRFAQALGNLIGSQSKGTDRATVDILIEVGPHSALKGPIEETLKSANMSSKVKYVPSLIRKKDAAETILDVAAVLFNDGYHLNLAAVNSSMLGARKPVVLTNLPGYSWNHSRSYWSESRIAHQHRTNSFRHNILGTLVYTSNDLEPVWRNNVRLEHMPWLRDHKIDPHIVFPMSGYISMAIQASYQQAKRQSVTVASFTLREVSVSQALIISEDEDAEMTISLRPFNHGTRQTSEVWNEFVILSWKKVDGWRQHCRGLISVIGPFVSSIFPRSTSTREALQLFKNGKAYTNSARMKTWDSSSLYNILEKLGVCYGPAFQGLEDIQVFQGYVAAKLRIPSAAGQSTKSFNDDPIIHPCTLDICAQTLVPSIMTWSPELDDPLVPTFIESMFVRLPSNKAPQEMLEVFALNEKDEYTSDDITSTYLSYFFEKKGAVPVEGNDKISFKEVWNTCVGTILPSQYQRIFNPPMLPASSLIADHSTRILSAEQASLYFIQHAVKALRDDDAHISAGRHGKLWNWMKKHSQLAVAGSLPMKAVSMLVADDPETTKKLSTYRSSGVNGMFVSKIGENLPDILMEKIEPLELMVEDGMLNKVYESCDGPAGRLYPAAAIFMGYLVHENPTISVLEIGAGTGGLTLPILKAVDGDKSKRAGVYRYDFTDIGPSFLENARLKFSQWQGLLRYRVLDIEKDPISQGFDAHSYDLVVASQVLHVSADMQNTMRNVRLLLKPGGRLLLIECTKPILANFPFATLPGWWRAADGIRDDGPIMQKKTWNTLLNQTGFSGIDGCVEDYPGEPIQSNSMIISTASSAAKAQYSQKLSIIWSQPSEMISIHCLQTRLQELIGYEPPVNTLNYVVSKDCRGETFIFLDHFEKSTLACLTAEEFVKIQKICHAGGLLWVTQGATQESLNPDSAMITGLFRCLRNEDSHLKLITLDFDAKQKVPAEDIAEYIAEIVRKSFQVNSQIEVMESEYSERGGIIQIPRIFPNHDMDEVILAESQSGVPSFQKFPQQGRPLKLTIGQPGLLDTLYFTDDIEASSPLQEGEIKILVHAMGLLFKHTLLALGEVPGPLSGVECSGVVTDIGPNVTSVDVGDRVCAIGTGACVATFARMPSLCAVKIPDDMSFTEGAAFPFAYITAYYSLIELGHLKRGESVLVHAAAGGVGQAAVAISQMIGAETFVTVGTDEKRQHLIDTYGVSSEKIFNSRNASFVDEVMRATSGKGVDVVLNSLAGELFRSTWECLGSFGRFIEIGRKDLIDNTRIEMAPFARNVTFSLVDLRLIMVESPDKSGRLLAHVMKLLGHREVKRLSPIAVYPVDKVESAFRALAGGNIIGKVVIDLMTESLPKVTPRRYPEILFRREASYLITGGGGGIGRALAVWMVRRGARHIILASRRGLQSIHTRDVCSRLESEGANVHVFACDVSSKVQVTEMLSQAAKNLPPICGVFHCVMVLKNSTFEDMAHEEYTEVAYPKVHGAWNIHNGLLDAKLDFFVSLSSGGGITGIRKQAAYAAASTFLSAFARYRRTLGLPAACISLAPVRGIGYLSENRETRELMETMYINELNAMQFFALCTAAIMGEHFDLCSHEASTGLRNLSRLRRHYHLDSKFNHCDISITKQTEEKSITTIVPLKNRLKNLNSKEETHAVIEEALTDKVCGILSLNRPDIDTLKSLTLHGIDSLSAVELRNYITLELGTRFPLTDIRKLSISELAYKSIEMSSSLFKLGV